jgi:hypothetical protein
MAVYILTPDCGSGGCGFETRQAPQADFRHPEAKNERLWVEAEIGLIHNRF